MLSASAYCAGSKSSDSVGCFRPISDIRRGKITAEKQAFRIATDQTESCRQNVGTCASVRMLSTELLRACRD